ncbi:MAG: ORF6N domain-containing protein [Bacteroidota bacterium]|nr:ORF6N domain-containing protein [Bacteroidota bacterium]
MKEENALMVPEEVIMSKIYFIHNQKVMLDADLAVLYGVSTGNLNKAVQRNIKRFPEDFMFQLTKQEFDDLIFQSGTSSWGGTRKLPYAFTEQGVAMLSSVLHSDRAIMVNIQIVRVFTRMRQLLETHTEILHKLDQLQKKDLEQDRQILLIFEYLKQLEQVKQQELEFKERKRIGFKRGNEK